MSFNSVMVTNHLERAAQLEMDFCTAYENAVAVSYTRKLQGLNPGEVAPEVGKLFTAGEREEFEKVAAEFYTMISSELDKAETYVNAAISESPAQDAVNYISMMNNRSHVSKEELQVALDKYGANFAAYQAIRDVGVKNEIYLPENPVECFKMQISQKRRELTNITLIGAETGKISKNMLLFDAAMKEAGL